MPIYEFACEEGHRAERFVPVFLERDSEPMICDCGFTMGPVISRDTTPLLWAEEGRPRLIHHLGPQPVAVTSHADLRRKMQARGLEFAGSRRGQKGCW